ncbi:protein neprosin-like [Euphorbia lathyris]|uniref:protein neprosin-like n=1 Tax=Euphorbia lathyris TaxID=212925 RepID=UPI00331433C5
MAIRVWILLFLLIGFSRVNGRKNSSSVMKNYTIQGENGEVIECVDIYKQPAFSHHFLKNHVIQMRPSSSPNVLKEDEKQFQRWQKYGKCPEGSIPILRTTLFNHSKTQLILQNTPQLTALGKKHREFAFVAMPQGGKYYGINGRLNLWNPKTYNGEYSLAEVRLTAGIIGNAAEINSIEAGWQVIEDNPKLFIHWTRDNFNQTGCYNLNCPGFVQVSNVIALGADLHPVSTYDGPQFDLVITVHKDMASGNWWLKANGQDIGYFPGSIFTSLAQNSNQVSWGGEITDSKRKASQNHTSTQMGSGHLPSEGYKKAAYIHSIQYMNESGQFLDADHDNNMKTFAPFPGCYELAFGEKGKFGLGVHFFYGGPPPSCGGIPGTKP